MFEMPEQAKYRKEDYFLHNDCLVVPRSNITVLLLGSAVREGGIPPSLVQCNRIVLWSRHNITSLSLVFLKARSKERH